MGQGKSHFTIVGGKRIHYEFLQKPLPGERKPLLVFLHEGLGSIRQWKDFPELLAARTGYPALLYDRYGYGLSEELKEPIHTRFLHDEAIESLPELYRQLGFDKHPKILIGHSDGGTIALIHAGTCPEGVLGVIVEAPHVMVEEATLRGVKEVKQDAEQGRLKDRIRKYHHEKTDFLVTSWVENWLSEESLTWNAEEYLPLIRCPVLAIQGDQDRFGSYAQLEAIHNKARDVRILFLSGCGHVPHQQARETVLEAMESFITEVSKH